MNANAIGKNIRKYRKEKEYTQEELAKKIGKGRVTVSKYERGSLTPSPYALVTLASVFGVCMIDILRDNE